METAQSRIEVLHEEYLARRNAYKDAERRFNAMVAAFPDTPAELKTRLDYIEVTGPGTVAVNPPPAGPPWAQPATAPEKKIVTSKQWAKLDEYNGADRFEAQAGGGATAVRVAAGVGPPTGFKIPQPARTLGWFLVSLRMVPG